jgi:signal transduction histidine kinase
VSYRNLAPGSYHFRVNATDTNGVWSDKVATAEFAILPAFYQTAWFLLLCVVAVLTALYMFYLLRLRQVSHQFHVRMNERVNERTRIARELHDTLLQTFQGLLLQLHAVSKTFGTSPDDARRRLDRAIDQAEHAIIEGRDAVQGLRSSTLLTNDLSAALSSLGQELAPTAAHSLGQGFHLEVEGTPRELHPILRDDVYRIAGEAMRNAFRHADAHRIEVTLRYEEQRLIVRVRDDGKGIRAEVLEQEQKAGHWGLQGMRERARRVGAELELSSRPGSGTEVELSLPASKAYQSSQAGKNWFSRRGLKID